MFVVVGLLWFLSSSLFSTWANTAFLQYFKDPMLHTLIRFFGSAVFGLVTLLLTKGVTVSELPTLVNNVVTPALLLWLANYSNSISLQMAGITLTYVVKACIPVFTVLICTLRGQKFPIIIYVSLIPIVAGVILASGSDLDFSLAGLSAALVSALAQTFMNISIKSVREVTGYSGPKAFLGMTIVSTFATLPVIATVTHLQNTGSTLIPATMPSSVDIFTSSCVELMNGQYWPVLLMVLAALAYHVEYALNFVFVGYVSTVAFSVSDIARRIAIIITGAVVFNKVLTSSNWVGIVVALSGVLWYSYLEQATKKPTTTNNNSNNNKDDVDGSNKTKKVKSN